MGVERHSASGFEGLSCMPGRQSLLEDAAGALTACGPVSTWLLLSHLILYRPHGLCTLTVLATHANKLRHRGVMPALIQLGRQLVWLQTLYTQPLHGGVSWWHKMEAS